MPLRDSKWLALVRMLFCVKCGVSQNIQAAHISRFGDGGMAEKSGDDRVLPLCASCHSRQHRVGEVSFWGGIEKVWDAIDWAGKLYAARGDVFKVRRMTMEAKRDLM